MMDLNIAVHALQLVPRGVFIKLSILGIPELPMRNKIYRCGF